MAPEGGACVAALRKLKASGHLSPDDVVVAVQHRHRLQVRRQHGPAVVSRRRHAYRLLYRDDPYLLEFDARVVERRQHEGRPAVVLDQTAFYAESGGQPWDTGPLGGVPVVAVVEQGDGSCTSSGAARRRRGARPRRRRPPARPPPAASRPAPAVARVRRDGRGADRRASTSAPTSRSIDLDRDGRRTPRSQRAETRANEVVWEARPVARAHGDRARGRGARRRARPERPATASASSRPKASTVQPCGARIPGPPPRSGVVLVLGHERYKGGTRVRFVCGHRALAAFHAARGTCSTALGAALVRRPSAPARGRASGCRRSSRTRERRRARPAGARPRRRGAPAAWRGRPGRPPSSWPCLDGWTPADLRALAERLVAAAPCVALLGSRAEKAHLVFAQSDGLPHDVPALLAEGASALVGGRGGGKGNLAQGGGERVDGLEEALAAAARERRGPPRRMSRPRRLALRSRWPSPSPASRWARSSSGSPQAPPLAVVVLPRLPGLPARRAVRRGRRGRAWPALAPAGAWCCSAAGRRARRCTSPPGSRACPTPRSRPRCCS